MPCAMSEAKVCDKRTIVDGCKLCEDTTGECGVIAATPTSALVPAFSPIRVLPSNFVIRIHHEL